MIYKMLSDHQRLNKIISQTPLKKKIGIEELEKVSNENK